MSGHGSYKLESFRATIDICLFTDYIFMAYKLNAVS